MIEIEVEHPTVVSTVIARAISKDASVKTQNVAGYPEPLWS
jgi:hypothetical protein